RPPSTPPRSRSPLVPLPPRRRFRAAVWAVLATLPAVALVVVLVFFLFSRKDPVQPGSRWTGDFKFRPPAGQRGDAQLSITERSGETFKGVYTSEKGDFEWEVEGTVRNGNIEWGFTRVIREKTPAGVVGKATVKGTYGDDCMDAVFQDADSTADL